MFTLHILCAELFSEYIYFLLSFKLLPFLFTSIIKGKFHSFYSILSASIISGVFILYSLLYALYIYYILTLYSFFYRNLIYFTLSLYIYYVRKGLSFTHYSLLYTSIKSGRVYSIHFT